MATKNLSDVLFEKKSKREEFLKYFVELTLIGEKLIRLSRDYEKGVIHPSNHSLSLIEQWRSTLQQIVFLDSERGGLNAKYAHNLLHNSIYKTGSLRREKEV